MVGGSGGLGAEIARMLAARGSDVAVTFRGNEAAGKSVAAAAAELGVRSSAHALDVTSADDCASVLAEVADAYGGLHTLVYAAGPHVPMVHLSNVSPADFAEQLSQDAVGFFNVAQPALPLLRRTKGSIVAVTTAATARFPVRDGLSSAPKGAVEALVRALAAEEGRFGVRVNAVGPGMLTDGMAARLIDSGELNDEALAITRSQHPVAPVRQRHRHRRGGLLPGLGPGRIHHRPEARRRRRLHRLSRQRRSSPSQKLKHVLDCRHDHRRT